jgi:hypothetical protein
MGERAVDGGEGVEVVEVARGGDETVEREEEREVSVVVTDGNWCM